MWSLDQFKEYLGGKSLKSGKSTTKLEREVNSSQSAARVGLARPKTSSTQGTKESPEFVKSKAGAALAKDEGKSEFLEAG